MIEALRGVVRSGAEIQTFIFNSVRLPSSHFTVGLKGFQAKLGLRHFFTVATSDKRQATTRQRRTRNNSYVALESKVLKKLYPLELKWNFDTTRLNCNVKADNFLALKRCHLSDCRNSCSVCPALVPF